MIEESSNPLPDFLTPVQGTEKEDGTAAIPSEETPKETTPETESHAEEKSDGQEEQPFHEENGIVFKTKDEYIAHVHKRLGGASQIAGKYKALEAEHARAVEELNKLKSGNNDGGQKTDQGETPPEVREALEVLKKNGVLTKEDMDKVLSEKLSRFERIATRIEQEEIESASKFVDNFIKANPDAAEMTDALRDTILKMDAAGIQGGIHEAYFLLTGKLPEKLSPSEQKSVVKNLKAAQAGGAPSNASSAAAKSKQDFMDNLLSV